MLGIFLKVMVYRIKDIEGNDYEIQDIKSFSDHIFKYHSSGVSLHTENGYTFKVDEKFRKIIKAFIRRTLK